MGVLEWLRGSSLPFDVKIIGYGRKARRDDLKGYVVPEISPENKKWDLIKNSIDAKSSPAVLYAGKTGSGKTTLASEVVWQKTSVSECQMFGREPERAVIFSPKTMEIEEHDFALPDFTSIDMTRQMPSNIFEYPFSFVGAILTACYSDVNLKGMMFKGVERQIHKILSENKVKSWEEFEEAIRSAKQKRNEFNIAILEAIEGDIIFLKAVGQEGNLNIDWSDLKTNYLLDFGGFGENEIAKVFAMEYWLRVMFKFRLKNILMIDECNRLLNKSESSIISKVLREGRTSIKLHLITQNISDIPPENLQFGSIFLHETQNVEDKKAVMDEFTQDYLKLLRGHRFLDATAEHYNEIIPIYELNPERLDKVRNQTRQKWLEEEKAGKTQNNGQKREIEFVSDGRDVRKNGDEFLTEEEIKRHSCTCVGENPVRRFLIADGEGRIREVISQSKTELSVSEILVKMGHERDCDCHQGIIGRLIRTMAKSEKIRIRQESGKTTQKRKIVRAEIEPKIIEIVSNSEFGLYSSEVLKLLGFEGLDRANVDKIVKSLVANGKIKMIQYVEAGLRPDQKARKIYYLNLQNEETQIHKRGVLDIKKVCESIGENVIGTYVFNQGWDVETEKVYLDFKTGLQNDVKDDIRKMKESNKKTIFVCVNYDEKRHYENTLKYAEGNEGRYFVCCLNELEDVFGN